jgi:hypothetical protein
MNKKRMYCHEKNVGGNNKRTLRKKNNPTKLAIRKA